MDQSNLSSPPEGTDRARHRGIFSRSAATADAAFEAEMAGPGWRLLTILREERPPGTVLPFRICRVAVVPAGDR